MTHLHISQRHVTFEIPVQTLVASVDCLNESFHASWHSHQPHVVRPDGRSLALPRKAFYTTASGLPQNVSRSLAGTCSPPPVPPRSRETPQALSPLPTPAFSTVVSNTAYSYSAVGRAVQFVRPSESPPFRLFHELLQDL